MKKIFTLNLVAALIALTTTAAAQNANNPWHLTALENGKEIAFYNVDSIVNIELSADKVIIALKGKNFSTQ